MEKLKNFFRNLRIYFRCNKDKHNWYYYTAGNRIVDCLDGTFGFCDFPVRECQTCGRFEIKLTNSRGYELYKGKITIDDLELEEE